MKYFVKVHAFPDNSLHLPQYAIWNPHPNIPSKDDFFSCH